MILQPLKHIDLPFLSDVQPQDWPDITPYFDYYTSTSFCFPFKVLLDGKLAGVGTTILHDEVAWLAHIIVAPEHRNKGIGKFITQELVDFSKSKNCSTILLIATDLGAPVYEKIGFETDTEYLFFKDLSSFPLANTLDIHPFIPEYKNQLLKLDLETSGENRSMQLEAYLAEALVYKRNENIEGFYLPSLNEGLIVANTVVAGIELIKYRSQTRDRISFPIENKSAREFLYQQGYQEFKTAKRMWLGTKRPWNATQLYNRIGGNLG